MATVYDYKNSNITTSKGEVIPFNSGTWLLPEEAIVLLRFKEGTLSFQEAYYLLKNDASLIFE